MFTSSFCFCCALSCQKATLSELYNQMPAFKIAPPNLMVLSPSRSTQVSGQVNVGVEMVSHFLLLWPVRCISVLSRAPTAAQLLGMWVLGADHFLATNSPPGRDKSASQVVTRKSNILFVSFYSLQLTPLINLGARYHIFSPTLLTTARRCNSIKMKARKMYSKVLNQ